MKNNQKIRGDNEKFSKSQIIERALRKLTKSIYDNFNVKQNSLKIHLHGSVG